MWLLPGAPQYNPKRKRDHPIDLATCNLRRVDPAFQANYLLVFRLLGPTGMVCAKFGVPVGVPSGL